MPKRLFGLLFGQNRFGLSRMFPGHEAETPKRPPFTRWVTFGRRSREERCDVVFVDESNGRRVTIVDGRGKIVNFPGIEKGDWTNDLSGGLPEPAVQFRTSFEKCGADGYIMLWQVQPDGRYWADEDGFGMTNDREIKLYALIDSHGSFDGPFRIYDSRVRQSLENRT